MKVTQTAVVTIWTSAFVLCAAGAVAAQESETPANAARQAGAQPAPGAAFAPDPRRMLLPLPEEEDWSFLAGPVGLEAEGHAYRY